MTRARRLISQRSCCFSVENSLNVEWKNAFMEQQTHRILHSGGKNTFSSVLRAIYRRRKEERKNHRLQRIAKDDNNVTRMKKVKEEEREKGRKK